MISSFNFSVPDTEVRQAVLEVPPGCPEALLARPEACQAVPEAADVVVWNKYLQSGTI